MTVSTLIELRANLKALRLPNMAPNLEGLLRQAKESGIGYVSTGSENLPFVGIEFLPPEICRMVFGQRRLRTSCRWGRSGPPTQRGNRVQGGEDAVPSRDRPMRHPCVYAASIPADGAGASADRVGGSARVEAGCAVPYRMSSFL